MKKKLWTDFHNNVHIFHLEYLEKLYDFAKEQLDFWPIAYYPFFVDKIGPKDMHAEGLRPEEIIQQNWNDILAFIKEHEKDGYFIMPGYEWQGSGKDGDHNIFFTSVDKAIKEMLHPLRYEELYKKLDIENVVAIPHHTGYKVGHRGKNWNTHKEDFSPIMEIYSSHGSSESFLSDIPLGVHIHMGPKTSEGTAETAIKKGVKTGFICSGDNHIVPGIAGNGYTAVLTEENTPESIMYALKNKHVYGVTRNKIDLDFTINNNIMGSTIDVGEAKTVIAKANIIGGTAIDRVEFFHNGIAEKTFVNNGRWEKLPYGDTVRFKFELELGWGPDQRVYPDIFEKNWDVTIKPTDGKILNYETLFMYPGSKILTNSEEEFIANIYTIKSQTGKSKLSQKNYRTPYIQNQSIIFEMECKTDSQINFTIDNKKYSYNIKTLLQGSRLEAQLENAYKLAKERYDIDDYYRSDPFWHNAYKFLIHQAVPVASYSLAIEETIEDINSGDSIFVKVTQKNSDKAWSSPIFID